MTSAPSSRLAVLRVLCAMFVASLGLYGLVAHAVSSGRDPLAAPRGITVLLGVFGLFSLVTAEFLGRAAGRDLTGEARDRGRFVGTLLAFALRESCAVVGLLLALVTLRPLWYAAFAAPAAAAMLIGWPRSTE